MIGKTELSVSLMGVVMISKQLREVVFSYVPTIDDNVGTGLPVTEILSYKVNGKRF